MSKRNQEASNNLKEEIDSVISRLRLVYGAEHDFELAKKMGISHSTIYSWRISGTFPWKKCFELARERKDISLDWLVTGKGSVLKDQSPENDDPVYGMLQIIFQRVVSIEGKLENCAKK